MSNNGAAKIWPEHRPCLTPDFQYLLDFHEDAVFNHDGRKPSNRPLLVWKNGAVRIEFLGTFPSVREAVARVKEIMADTSDTMTDADFEREAEMRGESRVERMGGGI